MQEDRSEPNFSYLFLGVSVVALFTLITFLVGQYLTAKMLLVLEIALLISGYLLYRGHRYLSLHSLVGSMFIYQIAVLSMYRDVPNIGLVWFLIVPTLIASVGRPVDILLWVPISIGGIFYGYSLVDQFPVMSHPMSLINLVGAACFMAVVSYRFVYDRQVREDQLTHALEKANAAEERSTRFLASMSHELRSPMTGIILSAEMLRANDELSEENRLAVERIYQGAQVTGNLLNDVLDLAKIEAKVSSVVRSKFEIESLLNDVFVTMEPHAAANNTRLSILTAPDCPDDWYSNASSIRQILINLVSNAIKHTQDGEVIISTVRDSDYLDFLVTDTGVGIAPDRQLQIFEPFVRLSETTTHGTGLGLTLAKDYAGILDCELELRRSEIGSGSQFCLRVPNHEYQSTMIAQRYAQPAFAGSHRKLVSDNDERRDWALVWLRHWSVELTVDGELLDLNSTAILTTRQLFEHMGGESLQVATGFDSTSQIDSSQAESVLGRCLICDDNPMIRDVFEALLGRLGYVTTAVADGEAALAHLQSGGADFMLLDVQLEEATGIEVVKSIRQSGQPFTNIPICMISGSLLGREDALAVGADEYLLKPPGTESLTNMAKQMSDLAIARRRI